jgi:hypothetical protein
MRELRQERQVELHAGPLHRREHRDQRKLDVTHQRLQAELDDPWPEHLRHATSEVDIL